MNKYIPSAPPKHWVSGTNHLQRGSAHFMRSIGRDWMSHSKVNVTQQTLKGIYCQAPFQLKHSLSLQSVTWRDGHVDKT